MTRTAASRAVAVLSMAVSPATAVPQRWRVYQSPARPTTFNHALPPAGVGGGKPGAIMVRAYHSGHDGLSA